MKYWVYMNGEVPGSFAPAELTALDGFSIATLVCPAEGEISEKNWRMAGEFAEIAATLAARDRAKAEGSSSVAPPAVAVDSMIDSANSSLLDHLSTLMKELESRREDKAFIVTLERRISSLKEDLLQAREQSSRRERDVADARAAVDRMKSELEGTKQRLKETALELASRDRLIEKLTKEIGEKELSLAKALGVIKRLEENLGRLRSDPEAFFPSLAPQSSAVPAPPDAEPKKPKTPEAALPSYSAPYTVDEPPPAPPYLEPPPPPERSNAQKALAEFLKRLLPEQPN